MSETTILTILVYVFFIIIVVMVMVAVTSYARGKEDHNREFTVNIRSDVMADSQGLPIQIIAKGSEAGGVTAAPVPAASAPDEQRQPYRQTPPPISSPTIYDLGEQSESDEMDEDKDNVLMNNFVQKLANLETLPEEELTQFLKILMNYGLILNDDRKRLIEEAKAQRQAEAGAQANAGAEPDAPDAPSMEEDHMESDGSSGADPSQGGPEQEPEGFRPSEEPGADMLEKPVYDPSFDSEGADASDLPDQAPDGAREEDEEGYDTEMEEDEDSGDPYRMVTDSNFDKEF